MPDYNATPFEQRGAAAVNRPRVPNALSLAVMHEVGAALARIDADASIGCAVITGSDRASRSSPQWPGWRSAAASSP